MDQESPAPHVLLVVLAVLIVLQVHVVLLDQRVRQIPSIQVHRVVLVVQVVPGFLALTSTRFPRSATL